MKRPLCVVCLLFSLLWAVICSHIPLPSYDFAEGEELYLKGKIAKDEGDKKTLYMTDVFLIQETDHTQIADKSSIKPISANVKVYLKEEMPYRTGEQIIVRGTFHNFLPRTNQGQFDQRKYQWSLGNGFLLNQGIIVEQSNTVDWLEDILGRLGQQWGQVYDACSRNSGILRAMILGQREEIDSSVKNLYQRAGISHLLAISALHISFLGMLLFRLGKKCGLPCPCNILLSAILIMSYGKITGMSFSTERAIIMFLLYLGSVLAGRTYDLLTALAVSMLYMTLHNPAVFYHSGFQMSFCAVAGIGSFVPCLQKLFPGRKGLGGYLIKSFLASLGIQIFLLPVLLNSYYEFSPYAVFLNLLVIPLMGIVLVSGMLGGIWGMLLPWGAEILLLPADLILDGYEWLCRLTVQLPKSTWIVGKPVFWQGFFYYAVLFGGIWMLQRKAKSGDGVKNIGSFAKTAALSVYIMSLLGILIVPIQIKTNHKTCVTMLDVGQGDCFLVQMKGCILLIDGGTSSQSGIGMYCIEPFLKSQGISEVDYILVSHSDKDHTSGLVECMERSGESGIDYCTLVLTEYAKRHAEEYKELIRAAESGKIEVEYVKQGDGLSIYEDAALLCLYPETGAEYEDVNDSSMVLLLSCKGKRMLFTGDISEAVEEEICDALREAVGESPRIDYLKVAHHGSKTASSEEFLHAVMPMAAFISAGKDNRYGHPHRETVDRLKKQGCFIYNTAELGGITVFF